MASDSCRGGKICQELDLHFEFDYKGYKFSIETPHVGYWIECASDGCPNDIFDEIIAHFRQKKVSELRQWFVEREYKKRAKLSS